MAALLISGSATMAGVAAPGAAQTADAPLRLPLTGALTPDAETGPAGRSAGTDFNERRLAQALTEGFDVADAAGEAGAPIPAPVTLPTGLAADYTFIMIRGMPQGFSASAGFQVKGGWVVSLKDAKGLSLLPAAGFEGAVPLEAQLVRGRDAAPETRRFTLTVRPAAKAALAAPAAPAPEKALPEVARPSAAAAPVAPPPARSSAPPTFDPDEEAKLLTAGAAVMKQGHLAAARLMFEELANKGSAKGAFALAQTFDPVILKTTMISGIKPDLAKAQYWYEQAKQLGSADAESRLADIRAGR